MKLKLRHNLIINGKEYPLSSNKLLLGSADNCDISVSDNQLSISHYHAMIFVDSDCNISVLDLNSTNGTFINGQRISNQTPLLTGDTVTFGKIHCELLEANEKFDFEARDEEIQVFKELQDEKQYVPKPINENDVLIDDEYCDILFQDNDIKLPETNPLKNLKIDIDEYVEYESLEDSFELRETVHGSCIQVTTALNGAILEQYYFPIQDGTIYANNKSTKGDVQLDLVSGKTPLLKVNNGMIELEQLEGFNLQKGQMSIQDDQQVLSSNYGPLQVFVEISEAPHNFIHVSSTIRDREFFKDTAKKFAAVIVPMLLLLLVDFRPEKKKPLKQLSIIYKKPTKANVDNKKMASTNPNDLKKNTGHKNTKQPDKKIAHSKAGKKALPKKAPKKVAKTSPKKAAKRKAKSKTKAKTKAYSFKMASNISSAFSSSKSAAVVNNNAPSSVSTKSKATGSLSTKVNGTSSNNVGNMGSDSSGRAVASFGSKGLSSKSGRDTAYIQTKTVVLGSMDPELLRKILQQYLPQFRHCYQQELAYNSEDIKGIVDLNFEITGSGKVAKIKVQPKDSRFSKRGTNCMAKVLAIIDFPKPKGGGRVAVRQPLSFFSEREKS